MAARGPNAAREQILYGSRTRNKLQIYQQYYTFYFCNKLYLCIGFYRYQLIYHMRRFTISYHLCFILLFLNFELLTID